ncbi:hypothetical protein DRQ00_07290 [candidate division KSB1 bacterium]|nr:MAG: hypothetical protein B5M50_03645 [candidate division KSB1 bacterium 4484_219]RKY77256.1 MAG: hypothetical protein DRQ00_07290 [candidate division KSB1 bacterium]RKY88410.1 MAG: hypothetical protein DRQ11_03775 [candidate division KSB1 bacterium]
MKILHIAPFNTAGVPLTFVQAERSLGYYSRLVTLARHPYNFPEDICLKLPLLNFYGTNLIKKVVSPKQRLQVGHLHRIPEQIPIQWHPKGAAERLLIRLREKIWQPRIRQFMTQSNFWQFDVYQLDGGLEFYRDGRTVKKLKDLGKKIICCYTGSDLRVRGVIPEIDAAADLNVTVEFDHIYFHPRIHHVFFPFDLEHFVYSKQSHSGKLRIGHAPTQRQAKGSDVIIAVLKKIQQKYPIEIILIEKLSYHQALQLKSTCDIFIDQIGDLGYGINSLEALAMGIPTCSSLVRGFADKYPDHPFVEINADNLESQIIYLIENENYRRRMGEIGREWLRKYHDAVKVVQHIHRLARIPSRNRKWERK